jgi:hypothetical protein
MHLSDTCSHRILRVPTSDRPASVPQVLVCRARALGAQSSRQMWQKIGHMAFRPLAICIYSNCCLLLPRLCTALLEAEQKKVVATIPRSIMMPFHCMIHVVQLRMHQLQAFECNPRTQIECELTSGFESVFCTV